jgi:hypothetical protein
MKIKEFDYNNSLNIEFNINMINNSLTITQGNRTGILPNTFTTKPDNIMN